MLIRGHPLAAEHEQAETGAEKKEKSSGKEMNDHCLPSLPFLNRIT
jgi:hypothetical protein